MINKKILACLVLMAASPFSGLAAENKKYAVTLGNPWLGAKCNISRRVSAELRYAFDPDAGIISLRGSYNFYAGGKVTGFAGAEYGSIRFNYLGISGSGSSLTPFIGGEYFLEERFSIGLDLGYSLISISSQDFSVNGPEYVYNIVLSYYLPAGMSAQAGK